MLSLHNVYPRRPVDRAAGFFNSLLNDDTLKVPAQFSVDQATLKRKIRIKGEDAQWAIQFEQHILGETHDSKIYYNREDKALTISSLDQNFITRIEAELDSRK